MYTPLLIVCLRLFWPFELFDREHAWSHDQSPKWSTYGQIAVGLIQSQSDTTQYFIRKCLQGNCLSAALGINFHLGGITEGHAKGLRQLLLIAGDVESNPGPTEENSCSTCGKKFESKRGRNEHEKIVHGEKNLECHLCGYRTAKPSNLERHVESHDRQSTSTAASTYQCQGCSYQTVRRNDLKRHQKTHAKAPEPKRMRIADAEADEEIQRIVRQSLKQIVDRVAHREETALKKGLRVVELQAGGMDPHLYLNAVAPKVKDYVEYELEKKTGIKLQLVLSVNFHKALDPQTTCVRAFRSKQISIFRGSDYEVADEFPRMLAAIEKFIRQESGWVITHLSDLKLYMATCKPLRGSTYKPLPKKLVNKEAIVNIKNSDNKCFVWSVLAKLHPEKYNPNRVKKYEKYESDLNMIGIDMPVPLGQIGKFERLNNIAINVYGFDDDNGLHPLKISKAQHNPLVHLLLYDGHYSLIKNLDRLLHDQTKHEHRLHFCPRCLIHRSTKNLLDEHLELCKEKEPTKIVMPEEKSLKFTNHQRTLRQPLTVYADFECLTKEIQSCERNPDASYTSQYQKHEPCGYGLVQAQGCCGENAKFSGLEVERGQDPVTRFLQSLMAVVVDYHNAPDKSMVEFDSKKHACDDCHICGKRIESKKVKDHCHRCGRYRGPAHESCNLNLRLNKDVVVVFHNLRKYDGHLIMRKIGEVAKLNGFDLSVVAKAMEDYISFSLVHKKEYDGKGGKHDFRYNIKFIDSVQFLNNSLEGLVANLDQEKFKAMESHFDSEQLGFLLRKGVYPYDYMNNAERFEEQHLPSKEEFYNKLNDAHIGEDDYQHAHNVWNFFGIENMGQYHDLYLKTDVLLLADVFESFRQFCMEKYGLDPCHYMTAPSLAWDACLKKTDVELEMLKDPEMYLFCESGIRGGISMISNRYARANNPKMENYDPSKPLSYIIYLDANNLYGWAMVQKLPVDGFQWVDDLERDWSKVDPEGEKGYFLEVDLEYPSELHDSHNDYPLAPESMEISRVSSYCEKLKELMGLKAPPSKKLVPNLATKTKYILHIKNLQLYLRLGLKLKRVHRVLQFNQSEWMKDYIMFNTMMRAHATSEFDKDLLKLMNNAVFGKTMENVRKYRNIELVTSISRFEKLVAHPRFQDSCRFTEDLVGVSSLRPSTCLNKPIYCGLTVLDLSKTLMYEFHYDYIIPTYGDNARLLFTDTDSLCYWVQTDDIYMDMKRDSHLFDLSEYPPDHFCHSLVNKKVIGKMKDEAKSQIIEEFAGLRPKMYSLWGPKVEKKRAKGIKKRVVKSEITHEDYVNTLKNEDYMYHRMKLIRSHLHNMYSIEVNKKSLCAYDDKRWLLNSVESRAHGHYLNT